MKTSLKGRIALAVSEGVVDSPYLDSVGVWTVGIGHTVNAGSPDPKANRGKKYSIKELLDIFARDLGKFEKRVNDLVKVPLTQNEFDALVHFDFNTGGLHKSKLLKDINNGNKKAAGQKGFHGWLKPKELIGRRDKERDMFLKGVYGSTIAPLYTSDKNGKLTRKGTIDLNQYLAADKAIADAEKVTESVLKGEKVIVPETKKPSVGGWKSFLDAIGEIFSKMFGG